MSNPLSFQRIRDKDLLNLLLGHNVVIVTEFEGKMAKGVMELKNAKVIPIRDRQDIRNLMK